MRLFRERGDDAYYGEEVTQTEHALQAAWHAEKAESDASLIAAALLHDIGHLLHGHGEDFMDQGIDDEHERLGERWLRRRFGPEVTRPVEMHVAAKRYLCAVEPDYFEGLSPASVASLDAQGGAYSDEEAQEFIRQEHASDAVELRRWDDLAKVPGLRTPALEHFRQYLETAAKTSDQRQGNDDIDR